MTPSEPERAKARLELAAWLQTRQTDLVTRGLYKSFTKFPNYCAWRAALEELGKQYGVQTEFVEGESVGYAGDLLLHGADAEQIKALHILLFPEP